MLWRFRRSGRPGLPRPTTGAIALALGAAGPVTPRRRSSHSGYSSAFGARRPRRLLALALGLLALGPPRPPRRPPRPPRRRARPPPRSRLQLLLEPGGVRVAIVTSSGSSATNWRPPGRRATESWIVSLTSMVGDVDDDLLGDVGRQRFDGDLAGDVLEHAALLRRPGPPPRRRARSPPRPGSSRRGGPAAGRCARRCRAPGARCCSLITTGTALPPPSISRSKSACAGERGSGAERRARRPGTGAPRSPPL